MAQKRILIVDDEDDIREVAAMALEISGDYEVIAAADGEAAIATAAANQPDVILLDVMMPGLDGPSVYARLRETAATQNIPVIFLTAKVQTADRRALIELGARAIIAKPFDPMGLSQEIAQLMAW